MLNAREGLGMTALTAVTAGLGTALPELVERATSAKQRRKSMGEAAAMSRSWRVARRTVTLTMPQTRGGQVAAASIEWCPDMPRRLSRRELKQYRTGRDAAFDSLCGDIGIRGVLCDI